MLDRSQDPANDGYQLIRRAPLASRTTFDVPAVAAWLAELTRPQALPELLARPEFRDLPRLVLGGGSNVLFTRDFDGLVVALANRGIDVVESAEEVDRVRVSAGENWDGFVRWSLGAGYVGLENLVLIPGSVGAAPFQNIGAYGVEVETFIESVDAWDHDAARFVTLQREECAFAYRDSLFKQQRGRFVITSVLFRLPRSRPLCLDYAGVREELAAMGVTSPTATDAASAVERLRLRKLPNPADIGNAGSFFKNPVVPATQARSLQASHPQLPVFHLEDGSCKLSAAWLIQQCGFKGYREGDAGVSDKHALVLVNHGNATGAELMSLAERIRNAVRESFGVGLEPEPVVL
ncbi:UDP-N-acetylmuramate dehydrogenase [Ectothiorhodospiraceae bacterium WFHF3C12]|nr:UDP-N-acetylmuramate dehydrogenase [Ectothiorhodospiraceae bacterium WFHF3C12]